MTFESNRIFYMKNIKERILCACVDMPNEIVKQIFENKN